MAAACGNLLMLGPIYRFSQRGVGVFGSTLVLVASVGCTFTQSASGLWMNRCIAGAGEGVLLAIIQAMGAQTKLPDRTYALMNAALAVSSVAILSAIPLAVRERGAAGVFGLTVPCAAICLLMFLKAPVHALMKASQLREGPVSVRRMAAAQAAVLLGSISMQGLWVYAVVGGQRLGISGVTISKVMSVSLLLCLAGSALVSILVTRCPRLLLVAAALALFAWATLLFGYATSYLLYCLAICLLPLAASVLFPLLFGLLAEIDLAGRAAATGPIAMMIGCAIGPPAVGLALQHGSYSSFLFFNSGALIAALALTAIAGRARRRPGLLHMT
jgi:MFS family permease